MRRRPVYIAEVYVAPSVEFKIRHKHNVTAAEVREAVVLTRLVDARRSNNEPDRILVIGTTFAGRRLKVVLWATDEDEGMWRLVTAMPATKIR